MRLLKKLASGRCSMLTLITVIALASTLASGAGVGEEAKVVVAAAPTIESPQATPSQVAPVAASTEQQVSQASQPQEHHIEPKSAGVAPGSGPGEQAAESAPVAQHAQVADGKTAVVDAKTGERKGRSEGEKSATSVATGAESSKVVADASKASPAEKSAEKKADANKTSEPTKIASNEKGASSGASQGKPTKSGSGSSLSGKSAIKSKLPANLGTVTSTGSGGQALYMSKHDAYSAIAEKHGALAAHSSMMKKADKRQMHSFGGIQKASGGLGDMLSPFKGVTDGGLARSKYSLVWMIREKLILACVTHITNQNFTYFPLKKPSSWRIHEVHRQGKIRSSSLCCLGPSGSCRPDGFLRVAHLTAASARST